MTKVQCTKKKVFIVADFISFIMMGLTKVEEFVIKLSFHVTID